MRISEKIYLELQKDILQGKVHHRGIDMRVLKFEDPIKASGNMWRQPVTIVAGIEKDVAKKMIKIIKDSKIKVQPAIQDDKIRVSSKKLDFLQECMSLIKSSELDIPVQFINMRS